VALHSGAELDGTSSCPELLPFSFGQSEAIIVEVIVTVRRSQRGSDFGICQAARNSGVTAVPDLGRELATGLLHEELHQSAGVEIDEWQSSASFIAYDIGDRTADTGARATRCTRPMGALRAGNNAVGDQTFERRGGRHAEEARYRDPAVRDDHLLALAGSFKPVTQVRPQLAHGYIHATSVQHIVPLSVRRRPAPDPRRPVDESARADF